MTGNSWTDVCEDIKAIRNVSDGVIQTLNGLVRRGSAEENGAIDQLEKTMKEVHGRATNALREALYQREIWE